MWWQKSFWILVNQDSQFSFLCIFVISCAIQKSLGICYTRQDLTFVTLCWFTREEWHWILVNQDSQFSFLCIFVISCAIQKSLGICYTRQDLTFVTLCWFTGEGWQMNDILHQVIQEAPSWLMLWLLRGFLLWYIIYSFNCWLTIYLGSLEGYTHDLWLLLACCHWRSLLHRDTLWHKWVIQFYVENGGNSVQIQ